jgi:ribosomal protein S20
MPNLHASIKDLRKSKKRAAHNARLKTHIKALTRQFTDLVKEGKKAEAETLRRKLQQIVDKASKVFVLHANNAARRVAKATKTVSKMK